MLFAIGLVVSLIIGYILNVTISTRNLSMPEKAIKDGILTIQRVISYPIDFIANKIEVSKEKKHMYEEYNNLKKELELYQDIQNENEELRKHIDELQSLLDIDKNLIDYESINATVIGRDLAYWSDNIIINKGENAGITVNMPVVVSGGLIGKVVKTSMYNSTVKLLTANNDKISVKIKTDNQYAYGILDGYDGSTYTISGISQNFEIIEGATITTTGMGDIYPAGIVVGKVSGISKDNFDLSKIIEMTSDVDFNNISYVKVLKRGTV